MVVREVGWLLGRLGGCWGGWMVVGEVGWLLGRLDGC